MKHECFLCKGPEEGNLQPPSNVAVKCSTCVQGEVEYVNNHPKEFPEAHLTMAQINARNVAEAKRKRLARRRG